MSLLQAVHECTICYESFDESLHRPLTLVCDNESCGHTYCWKCIQEIQFITKKCPSCNVEFKFTITNWFVIDLIKKTKNSSLDNPFLDVLYNNIQTIEANVNEFSKLLFRLNKENEEYSKKIKVFKKK